MADFPRSQHWTVDGFRITVMHYKTLSGECAGCGLVPARHSVWADGRGELERFGSSPVHFCDDCRPAKGTLPPLDYVRLLSGVPSGVITYQRTEPWPGQSCSECGQPSSLRYQHQCPGCDDQQHHYSVTRVATGETTRPHLHHTTSTDYRCLDHELEIAGAVKAGG